MKFVEAGSAVLGCSDGTTFAVAGGGRGRADILFLGVGCWCRRWCGGVWCGLVAAEVLFLVVSNKDLVII